VEASFAPMMPNIEAPADPPIVTVRRIDSASLVLEAGKVLGTIEIASNGPFFEDELTIGGKSRLIRAAPGFRPILVVGPPKKDEAKKRPALFVLENKSVTSEENKRVTLEGLDLVV